MANTTVQCSGCERELAESPSAPAEAREPCPHCGSLARTFNTSMTGTITVSGSMEWEHTRAFYEQHRGWQALVLGLGLAGVLAGLVLDRWPAAAVALAATLAAYVLSPRAAMLVQRVERGRSG